MSTLLPAKEHSVCHLISGDLWAGAEVMLYNLLSISHKYESIKTIVILFNEGRLSEELKKIGIRVYVIDEKQNTILSIVLKVKEIIKMENITIIHSHRYKENFFAAVVSLMFNKLTIIATIHGMPEIKNFKDRIKYRLDYLILKKMFFTSVPVSNEIERKIIYKYNFPNNKVKTIHNGINLPQVKKMIKSDQSILVIGTAGRLFVIKNYDLLLDIVNLLKKQPIHFKIAGDGPQRVFLEEKCKKLNLQNTVEFCGNVTDMHAFYSDLDIYINTSIHEGIPISILEAMSYYLPIIAPRVGGIPEIIDDNIEGFLITPGEKEKFADACINLLNNKNLLHEMGIKARKKIENKFTIDICMERYFSLYNCKFKWKR